MTSLQNGSPPPSAAAGGAAPQENQVPAHPVGASGGGQAPPAPPEQKSETWSIGGILISRKLDVLACAAFLISITTIMIQLTAYFSGENLQLLAPDQVFIWKDVYPDKVARALFGATLIYVNAGQKGYGATVRRELVYVPIAGKEFEQGWDFFVTFDGFRIRDSNKEPAKPFSVDGRESKSHQTAFVPWPKWCPPLADSACMQGNHIHWDQFIAELKRLVEAGQSEYRFKFASEVIGRKEPATIVCKIAINSGFVSALEYAGGYSPTCFPAESSP